MSRRRTTRRTSRRCEAFARSCPGCPQVAAFETAFHQTIPLARQIYAIPHEWTEKLGIRRMAFTAHRTATSRRAVAELLGPECRRMISCHLGGSSSICAIEDGKSVAQ